MPQKKVAGMRFLFFIFFNVSINLLLSLWTTLVSVHATKRVLRSRKSWLIVNPATLAKAVEFEPATLYLSQDTLPSFGYRRPSGHVRRHSKETVSHTALAALWCTRRPTRSHRPRIDYRIVCVQMIEKGKKNIFSISMLREKSAREDTLSQSILLFYPKWVRRLYADYALFSLLFFVYAKFLKIFLDLFFISKNIDSSRSHNLDACGTVWENVASRKNPNATNSNGIGVAERKIKLHLISVFQ